MFATFKESLFCENTELKHNGNIYYDPGIKMEDASTKPKIKKRSQFRIKSQHLASLYKINEIVDITT